jgi:beta-galactosidase GanA
VNRYGKGIAVYFNHFPGEQEEAGLAAFVKKTAGFRDFFRASGLVVVKRGKSGGREVIFILNYENRALTVDLSAWKRKIRLAKREARVLWR